MQTSEDINYVKYGFWTFVFILYIYAGKEYIYVDMQYFVPYAVMHVFVLIFFVMIGGSIMWRSRYFGDHFVADGVSGSIYGSPIYVRDISMDTKDVPNFHWAVFNLGFSLLPPMRGKIATAVIPAHMLVQAGKNYETLTMVQKKPINLCPYAVASYLRYNHDDFNLENIYFGKYSKKFVDNSDVGENKDVQIEALNSLITAQKKIIEDKFGDFETLKEFGDRITGSKYSLKGVLKRSTEPEEE